MEILQHKRTEIFPLSKHFTSFYANHRFIVFDIETTGLNAKYEKVILIGLMYIEEGQPVIEQYFCHHRKNEPLLLNKFSEKIRPYDLLISYNGNSFDIPFLNQRFHQNGITYQINKYKNLDLLRFARKYQQHLNLTDCTLKSVEKSIGIHRKDTISGKESVELYKAYEKNPSLALKNKILLHNYEDIYYLGHCLQIIDHVSYDQALEQMPLILKPKADQIWNISSLKIKTNTLQVEGYYTGSPLEDCIIHENGYSFHYEQLTHQYQLRIPLYAGMLSSGVKCLYIDAFDFSFPYTKQTLDLPLQEHIIPIKVSNSLKTAEIIDFVNHLIEYILLKY
ncbi:ribonuclease H-like domain-containing protein [Geosporobacter ferrireducens]|uniref:YprB ribonuclease H-like domain-containing protein n=1 Tax=Geosporobacter ferrireducens TaxID=1424294 RepID=A0A1D8GCN7_9FIRM|nr:ribonuclease H-like domain-containing protein [Geosporobacter ferrireducens]AOT68677.1 hypothetical protein Gferi_03125 [Geosporobacter ferrireducens]MTI54154.1 hypothetical protein [Geosporobacter ferrireducens]